MSDENCEIGIFTILKQNRPELSGSSLRTYCSIVKNLSKQIGVPILKQKDIVDNLEKIKEHFKNVDGRLRKTRLAPLVVLLDNYKEGSKTQEELRSLMIADARKYDDEQKDQVMTQKQKEAMIPYEKVIEMYNQLEADVNHLWKKQELNKGDFQRLQVYVLLSCLLLIEPRRSLDYTEFKLKDVDESKDNFMKKKGTKYYFIFNNYKTAKRYGTQEVEIPKKLATIINNWSKLNTHEYLLMNTKLSNKINPTQLCSILYEFFGRPISTSMLRHIFLTHKYSNVPALKDMLNTASNMGHSLDQALQYVKKK